MTVTRNQSGIEVSAIVGGYLVSRLYVGYSVKEAKEKFRNELGNEDN